MYLLDTDILSYFIRGDADVVERFERAGSSILLVSVVSLYELAFGVFRDRGKGVLEEGLDRIIDLFTPLPIDLQVTMEGTRVRSELESMGRPAGPLDPLIAATARVHDLVLVTHNVKHFQSVPGLEIEDWKASE